MEYNNPDINHLLRSIKLYTREGQFTIGIAGGSLSDHVIDIDLYHKGYPTFYSLFVQGAQIGRTGQEVKAKLLAVYQELKSAIYQDEDLKDRFTALINIDEVADEFDEYQIFVGWKAGRFQWLGRDRVA